MFGWLERQIALPFRVSWRPPARLPERHIGFSVTRNGVKGPPPLIARIVQLSLLVIVLLLCSSAPLSRTQSLFWHCTL